MNKQNESAIIKQQIIEGSKAGLVGAGLLGGISLVVTLLFFIVKQDYTMFLMPGILSVVAFVCSFFMTYPSSDEIQKVKSVE